MELKLGVNYILSCRWIFVWIEPLWNWNWNHSRGRGRFSSCLNWTFMELKWNGGCNVLGRFLGFELNLYGIEIFWLVQEGFQVYQFELNLYGIEIRYWHEGLNLQHYVWIEPLWNWNSSCAIFLYSSVWVWIEPLWNWNCGLFKPRCPLSECLNWTFMELKFPISLSSSSRSCCLNWTFMELKYLH